MQREVDRDWFHRLLEYQEGRCWTCRDEISGSDLCVDHDHTTGLVRGLLCQRCNLAEGHGYLDFDWGEYRANPPAAQLGIEVRGGPIDPYAGLPRDMAADQEAAALIGSKLLG